MIKHKIVICCDNADCKGTIIGKFIDAEVTVRDSELREVEYTRLQFCSNGCFHQVFESRIRKAFFEHMRLEIGLRMDEVNKGDIEEGFE